MDSKQMIESILKQINADCIIANQVENDMYIQNFPSRWGGWMVRSPVTWRVADSYPAQLSQTNITVVAFDVLLRAQPDWEGSFKFPGTNDWVRNQRTSLGITDEELSMPNLYQIIYDRVHVVGKAMANWRPGQVEIDDFIDKMFSWQYKPQTVTRDTASFTEVSNDLMERARQLEKTKEECKKAQLDPSLNHVWDEAKLTDSQIQDINNWLHGPVNEPPKLGFYGKHPPTENEADEPVVVEKKINFREFL